MFPFKEEVKGNEKIRTFDNTVDESELVWHRDKEDRRVEVLDDTDWMFQLDEELPVKLSKGDSFEIPKLTYHRVLKGEKELKIKITFL